jgi:Flp pilus assembly protein TadD
MSTKTMKINPAPRGLLALTSCAIAVCTILSGCGGGHGAYTQAALDKSTQRLGAIKAGAEYETARQQFLSGDLDKALNTIDLAISLAPDVTKSHVLRGKIMLEKGSHEDSIESLNSAVALDGSDIEAHFHRGVAYERINRWEDALAQYTKCSELDPGEPRFIVAQSDILLELRRRDDARKILEEAMVRFPNSAHVRRSLGAIALLDGLPDLASQLLRESLLLAPEDSGVLEDLARAELNGGRFAEAEIALSELLRKDGMTGRRDLMHMRIQCLVEMNRLVDARTALLDLTRDRQGEADRKAWLTLGRVALKLNDMPRLRTSAARLIALEPNKPDGRLLMAVWQRRRGDLEGSLRSISAAIEITPKQQEAWVMRGVVLGEMGRKAEADEALRVAQGLSASTSVTIAGVVVEDSDR